MGGGAEELTFEKPAATADSDADIFHSGWNGTIFQLVTNTLNRTRDRVEKLDYVSPLNRALAGQRAPASIPQIQRNVRK
jgi:hypothetical protein